MPQRLRHLPWIFLNSLAFSTMVIEAAVSCYLTMIQHLPAESPPLQCDDSQATSIPEKHTCYINDLTTSVRSCVLVMVGKLLPKKINRLQIVALSPRLRVNDPSHDESRRRLTLFVRCTWFFHWQVYIFNDLKLCYRSGSRIKIDQVSRAAYLRSWQRWDRRLFIDLPSSPLYIDTQMEKLSLHFNDRTLVQPSPESYNFSGQIADQAIISPRTFIHTMRVVRGLLKILFSYSDCPPPYKKFIPWAEEHTSGRRSGWEELLWIPTTSVLAESRQYWRTSLEYRNSESFVEQAIEYPA